MSGEEGRGGVPRRGADFGGGCVAVLPDAEAAASAVALGLAVRCVDLDGSDCGGADGRDP